MEKNEKKQVEWYNEPSIITNLLLGVILINILLCQAFAIKNDLSALSILSSILTHNSIYILVFIYFIFLKTKIGKKYFDYLNIFLILIYSLISFTSLLSVLQSFNSASIMSLCIHIFFVLYLIHTFLRGTRLWKEFKLNKSPFNEFTNDGFFYALVFMGVVLLAVNLIMTTSFDGTILSLLDYGFTVLFARYIYLYGVYLDSKKIDNKNEGNFDKYIDAVEEEVKEKIDDIQDFVKETSENVSEKFNEVVDVEKISKAVSDANDKVMDSINEVKEKVEDYVEEKKIDDKIEDVKEKVVESFNDVKEKVEDMVEDSKKTKKRKSRKKNSKDGE